MVGLSLVAVFAITAIAATSASALPEWGKCTAKAGGKYLDSNCTKKGSLKNPGSFEWTKGKELKNVPFEGGNVGSGGVLTTEVWGCFLPETEGGRRIPRGQCEEKGGEVRPESEVSILCESEHNTGEATGTKGIANVSVKFEGCKAGGVIPCSNGPEEGEILVNQLKGELGYINKAEKKVGVKLEPVKKHGEFAKFNCAGLIEVVVGVGNIKEGAWYTPEKTGGYDGIISPITPVNTMTATYEQVFTVNPETHENIPSKFEGKHIELLENYVYSPEHPEYSSIWSPAAEEITNVNVASEAGEIKA